jgi:hypothetical protein
MALEFDEICGADPGEAGPPAGDSFQDLRPEFCDFKDEGCRFAPSCLQCPYKLCIHDVPKHRRRQFRKLRDKEIGRLFKSGRDVDGLAHDFGLNERTVRRIVRGKSINKPAQKKLRKQE